MTGNVEIRQPSAAPEREIGVVTAEIRELCAQARATAVAYIVEIGRRLYEAKGMLEHGEWGEWLKNEVGFSHSTANNYMKLFDEYGASQITIFGAVANSQTIGNLPYSKALALLAVPADEREQFAEEVKADELSVKELERVIKERDEERKRNEQLAKKLQKAEKAGADVKAATEKAENLRKQLEDAETKLSEAQKAEADTKAQLDEARNNATVPEEKILEIRKEAAAEAEKNSVQEVASIKKALADAEAARADAEASKAAAEKEVNELKSKIKMADPEVSAFNILFENLQDCIRKCKKQIATIRESRPEVADKLLGAMAAVGKAMGND